MPVGTPVERALVKYVPSAGWLSMNLAVPWASCAPDPPMRLIAIKAIDIFTSSALCLCRTNFFMDINK